MQGQEIDMFKRHRSFKELMAESKARREARPRWRKVRDWLVKWLVKNLWDHYLRPRAIACRITRFCQRRIRGFDDSELWGLDCEILKFAIPRIKRLREVAHGFPSKLLGDYEEYEKLSDEEQTIRNDQGFEEWRTILGKMARAMELNIEHGDIFLSEEEAEEGNYKEDPKLKAEFEEGWSLFQEYFFALWD